MPTQSLHFSRSRGRSQHGFTMIELMITVAILGILSSIAIPVFQRHQLSAKSAEVKSNLSSLRVVEESHFSERGGYIPASPEPALIPGSIATDFDTAGSDFAQLGWSPEGRVYFSYGVAVSTDLSGYTADGGADIDGDGLVQLWGYTKPDGAGAVINGAVGCDASFLTHVELGRCSLPSAIY